MTQTTRAGRGERRDSTSLPTRDALLAVAERLFLAEGYDKVSVRAICAAADPEAAARGLREAFGYQPGWGQVGPEIREEIEGIMRRLAEPAQVDPELLQQLRDFRFGDDELRFLRDQAEGSGWATAGRSRCRGVADGRTAAADVGREQHAAQPDRDGGEVSWIWHPS